MSIMENHTIQPEGLHRAAARKFRHYVTGAAAIGREIGCSAITVRRMAAQGRLKEFIFRSGKNTSPLRILRSDIDRIRIKLRERA
jgi:Protein of unknown function (DUF3853)